MKILIARNSGIGNFVESSPALSSLRKNLPDALIDVWVEDRAYDIAKGHPAINNLFRWPKIPTNGEYDFGLIFVFDEGMMTNDMTKICKKIIRHPKVDFINKSETLLNFEIIKQIGGWDGKYYPTSIYLSQEDLDYGINKTKNLKSPIIAFHTGCYTKGVPVHRKRFWNTAGWNKLAVLLKEKYDPTFILMGGPEEIKESKEFLKFLQSIKSRVVSVIGEYSIKQGAGLLKACDLLISIDSGIMHLCSTVSTKQIALFGPTSEIKSQIQTDQKNYAIVKTNINCRPCYTKNPSLFQKCNNVICMSGITPEMILDTIEKRRFLA